VRDFLRGVHVFALSDYCLFLTVINEHGKMFARAVHTEVLKNECALPAAKY
jgi:hypothetical protein